MKLFTAVCAEGEIVERGTQHLYCSQQQCGKSRENAKVFSVLSMYFDLNLKEICNCCCGFLHQVETRQLYFDILIYTDVVYLTGYSYMPAEISTDGGNQADDWIEEPSLSK